MKKAILFAVILIAAVSCQQSEQESSSIAELEIESAADNPCTQCTQRIQAALATCLQAAGNDAAKIKACNATASQNWVAQCQGLCTPGVQKNKSIYASEIESADANPCIQCTQRLQVVLASCLQAAGNDAAKRQACNKQSSDAWVAQCKPLCTP